MEQLYFNKLYFPHYRDKIYSHALMFTNYGNAQMDVLEQLFFAGKDAIVDDINWLVFLEDFNTEYSFVNNWLLDLSAILDEEDYIYHRSKIITRFKKFNTISSSRAEVGFKKDLKLSKTIKSTVILWNNFVNMLTQRTSYGEQGKDSFELWKVLQGINNNEEVGVHVSEKMINIFNFNMENRKRDDFYKRYNLNLNSEEQYNINLEDTNKKLNTLLFKNALDGSLSRKDKENKIFKI